MKHLPWLLLLSIAYSCKKTDIPPPVPTTITPTVKIESINRVQYEKIIVSASFQADTSFHVKEKGFCWSKNINPTINDSVRRISPALSFVSNINNIGQLTKFYFRAYIKTDSALIYSITDSIITGGVQRVWERQYENGKNRGVVQVIETSDNSFLLLIKTYGNSMSCTEVNKIDSSGNLKWAFTYNQNEWKEPNYIIKQNDGYVFATTNWVPGGRGIYLTKIDLNGNKIWEKSYNRKINQEFVRLTALSNDTLLLTTKAFDGFNNGVRTNCSINNFNIDLNGNILSETFTINNNKFNEGSYGFNTLNIANNDFLVSNYYYPLGNNGVVYDIIVQKFNKLNQLTWERTYGGTRDDYPVTMRTASNGNYIILANTASFGNNYQSVWMFEIDRNNGNKLWDLIYGTSNFTYAYDFYKTAAGEYHFTASGSSGILIGKVSTNGELLGEYNYKTPPGSGNGRPDNIITNTNNEIYLFGSRIIDPSDPSNTLFVAKFKEF